MFRIKTYKYYADNNRTSACQSPFESPNILMAGSSPLFSEENTFIYLYDYGKGVCASESSSRMTPLDVIPGTHTLETFMYDNISDIRLSYLEV